MDDVIRQSESARPVCNSQAAVAEFDARRLGTFCFAVLISRLLKPGGPPAVARLVITIVIGVAIECVFLTGASAHISNEISQRITPSLVDSYSTPAIPLVLRVSRSGAALNHCVPTSVFERPRQAMHVAAFCRCFPTKTTTTRGSSAQEVVTIDENDIAIRLASAFPDKSVFSIPPGKLTHEQPTEGFANEVCLPISKYAGFGGVDFKHINILTPNAQKANGGVPSLT